MSQNSEKSGENLLPKYTASQGRDKLQTLTARQQEALALFGEGLSGKQVAARMGVTEQMVSKYRRTFRRKLGLNTLSAIVRYATLRAVQREQAATAELRSVPYWAMPRA